MKLLRKKWIISLSVFLVVILCIYTGGLFFVSSHRTIHLTMKDAELAQGRLTAYYNGESYFFDDKGRDKKGIYKIDKESNVQFVAKTNNIRALSIDNDKIYCAEIVNSSFNPFEDKCNFIIYDLKSGIKQYSDKNEAEVYSLYAKSNTLYTLQRYSVGAIVKRMYKYSVDEKVSEGKLYFLNNDGYKEITNEDSSLVVVFENNTVSIGFQADTYIIDRKTNSLVMQEGKILYNSFTPIACEGEALLYCDNYHIQRLCEDGSTEQVANLETYSQYKFNFKYEDGFIFAIGINKDKSQKNILLKIDINSGKIFALMDDEKQKIVYFNNKNAYYYEKQKIFCYNFETKKSEEICKCPSGIYNIITEPCGDSLFIYKVSSIFLDRDIKLIDKINLMQ